MYKARAAASGGSAKAAPAPTSETPTCFKCGKPGHKANACTEKTSPKGTQPVKQGGFHTSFEAQLDAGDVAFATSESIESHFNGGTIHAAARLSPGPEESSADMEGVEHFSSKSFPAPSPGKLSQVVSPL